ncbi:hypothetical protein AB3N61_08555 [Leptospira sp. WS58.C1]|jgi:predicted NUDIX family NTP pyrophosphohydrolase|uniref:hypothetical protein n=1 Tax=Leptospira TaxID=171 RepID=UPI0002C02CE7|nr:MULTISPECIES: hypothetical protein [unclassified Leptospira]EMK01611.1 hypothetical protein LEP1GSC192_1607 [Leptospira sp. B5-022]MCR1793897.1 hypothetical protein [Leptospira sp. id769339]
MNGCTVNENVWEEKMKDRAKRFKDTLERYINYRGIDIILTLKDGTVIELDKNRKMNGDVVIKNGDFGIEAEIEISSIQKADFFAA